MRYLLFLIAFLTAVQLSAQTLIAPAEPAPPMREIGLRLFSLEDFSLVYKKERRPQRFWRLNLALGQLQVEAGESAQANLQLGAGFGWERRRPINDRLHFLTGPQLDLLFRLSGGEGFDAFGDLRPSLSYLLGVQYDLNDRFYINLEVLPSLSVIIPLGEEFPDPVFSAGFNTGSVGVTVAHRFSISHGS